ncbi:TIGR04438 family Trp-rich protein [Hydrogenophaga sp. NFH-34]|uniref:TIGR04438 family Trp-rich protein n=1 Tax=Hydrogenophaga sp. NFH-34 TaxID=2744446 RepID=UPI001F1F0756|nr:TIGR04438 family Trp-rich protein [Hydrogenophaga sp. NFH-34]
MYLLILGLLMALLKFLEFGFLAEISWWWVLVPFGLAALWWVWADSSGYTKRKAAEKIEQKKRDRIEKHRESLGLHKRRH